MLVSPPRAMSCSRAYTPASLRLLPMLRAAFSAGSEASSTAGRPSASSPRTPRCPNSRYSLSPAERASPLCRSRRKSSSTACEHKAAHSAAIRSGSRQGSSGLQRRPTAAHTVPSVKTAPLWVFTPSVAFSIFCSASRPIARRSAKASAAGIAAVSAPVRKNSRQVPRSARALQRKSSGVMSRWEPLLLRSTRPGLGVVSSSSRSAAVASSSSRSASA